MKKIDFLIFLRQRLHLKVALAGDAGETPTLPTMQADIFSTTRSDRKNFFYI